MIRWLLGLMLLFSFSKRSIAQYPGYFNYTIENGGPSNEVYSILEDKQGYIWIGCDAGLYRFNGVFFEHFTSPDLTSRSVSGVCQSANGRIYAYNFNGQLLYVENGKLNVVKNWKYLINQISPDNKGKVWLTTSKGLTCLDERTMTWKSIQDLDGDGVPEKDNYANSVQVSKKGDVFYFHIGRLIQRTGNKTRIYPINPEEPMSPAFVTNCYQEPWVFTLFEGACYRIKNGRYERVVISALTKAMKGRKITSTREIGNDIWITTHTGVIRYNKLTQKTQLLYPKIAFSGCIKDREGNYWFTTLHDGVLRMPNLDFLVWNEQTGALDLDKFTHLTASENKIFFAKSDGEIGELLQNGDRFQTYRNELLSDFGTIYFDQVENKVLFNKINSIFALQNSKISIVNPVTRPVKSFIRVANEYIMASSQGAYVYTCPKDGFVEKYKITDDWSRVLMTFPGSKDVFLSGNHGLYRMRKVESKWKIVQHLFRDEQISSITNDGKYIYALSFKGVIYRVQMSGERTIFYHLPENFRAVQLVSHGGKLFVATNNGLLILNKSNRNQMVINRFHGLSSNNISQVCIVGNYCWLATGRGLHRIPLHLLQQSYVKGSIVLKKILVNGDVVAPDALKYLAYNDQFSISVDGLFYKSNGNFSFAYRFVGDKEGWIQLPANAELLSIPRLPLGSTVMELKMIDHEDRDSENTLRFSLYVKPPFFQRWWFYWLLTVTVAVISFLIFKKRIAVLRKRQEQRLQQLRLENELRLTQQSALKAQMNPHFLFNVLNSIKGYIYENDKKNAAKYLSDFSNLVRKVLDLSALPTTTLADELETVKLYINLESMLLQDDFSVEISMDENVDSGAIPIPSLLLQPYVENAFKHGLRHKKGKKELKIAVSKDANEDVLLIQISDNGIGRKASEIINKNNSDEHVSFATSATQKRIELLNFEKQGIIGVAIQDLIASSGEALGTIVTIRIHLA
ncbi:MAG: histidine kinase [Fluviicola sp.]|nr:histidine kinase [Fluviicola sp.]